MVRIALACLLALSVAAPVMAANATRPYQNCDRKVDNCGPTGNDVTDQLNAQQLSGGQPDAPSSDVPATGRPLPR